ncbi:MAG: tetratricopeptide repeat protein [Chlorobiaceae bacterium]|jgi:tetratricopeptide (TPR) repeat protein|nr:tetratricopeptide repeat protein [Chlorobiaceae bacterium]
MIPSSTHSKTGPSRLPSIILLSILILFTSCTPKDDEINKLQQKVWKNPNNAEGYIKLGNAFARHQRYTEASEAFKNALALNPELEGAIHALGAVSFNQRNYSQALGYFQKYLERSPKDSLRLYDIGNTYMQLQQFDKAGEAYNAAIENSKVFVEAYYNLGVCYIRTGKQKEAQAIYEWLLDKNNYLAVSLQNHLKKANKGN